MNEKIKSVWNFIKERKEEIAVTAITAVVMTVSGVILFKSASTKSGDYIPHFTLPKPEKILPDLGVGEVSDVIRYDDGMVELWMDHIPLSYMGKLGEVIRAEFPDIPDNFETWALLNIHEPDRVWGFQE